jgi:hypothetical protein
VILKMFVLCNSLRFPKKWQVIECLNDEKGHIEFEAILDFQSFNRMINALLFLLFSYGVASFYKCVGNVAANIWTTELVH